MEFVCSFFRGNVSSFFRGNVSLKNSFRLCQTFTNCQDKLVAFGLSFQMVNERPINHKLCIVLIFFFNFFAGEKLPRSKRLQQILRMLRRNLLWSQVLHRICQITMHFSLRMSGKSEKKTWIRVCLRFQFYLEPFKLVYVHNYV